VCVCECDSCDIANAPHTRVQHGGVGTEQLRKELEEAHAQIETMELALAVANNKLMRAEHKTRRTSVCALRDRGVIAIVLMCVIRSTLRVRSLSMR
jgi:hypothetical protein